jgi:hypothetical protein
LVFVKVKVLEPGVERLEEDRARMGVEEVETKTDLVSVLLRGVVRLMTIVEESAIAGRDKVSCVAEAPRTIG